MYGSVFRRVEVPLKSPQMCLSTHQSGLLGDIQPSLLLPCWDRSGLGIRMSLALLSNKDPIEDKPVNLFLVCKDMLTKYIVNFLPPTFLPKTMK